MQYIKYKNGQYSYRTDPESLLRWRFGRRDDAFVNDCEIVVGGFALAQNVGWINVDPEVTLSASGVYVREGARATDYVLDQELDPIGFPGAENINWENLIAS